MVSPLPEDTVLVPPKIIYIYICSSYMQFLFYYYFYHYYAVSESRERQAPNAKMKRARRKSSLLSWFWRWVADRTLVSDNITCSQLTKIVTQDWERQRELGVFWERALWNVSLLEMKNDTDVIPTFHFSGTMRRDNGRKGRGEGGEKG